jgi:hypothetical protein
VEKQPVPYNLSHLIITINNETDFFAKLDQNEVEIVGVILR